MTCSNTWNQTSHTCISTYFPVTLILEVLNKCQKLTYRNIISSESGFYSFFDCTLTNERASLVAIYRMVCIYDQDNKYITVLKMTYMLEQNPEMPGTGILSVANEGEIGTAVGHFAHGSGGERPVDHLISINRRKMEGGLVGTAVDCEANIYLILCGLRPFDQIQLEWARDRWRCRQRYPTRFPD